MKIHTCIRDARRMELSELEAINRNVVEVQANIVENGNEDSETQEAKETETAKKTRKKKNKEGV